MNKKKLIPAFALGMLAISVFFVFAHVVVITQLLPEHHDSYLPNHPFVILSAFAEPECGYQICITDMNPMELPITRDSVYFLDVAINPNESLHAKIINWNDEIVYEENLSADDGKVSVNWKIPNEEKYLGTYRVTLTLVGKEDQDPVGLAFRVGSEVYHPRPMQFVSVLKQSTGMGINIYEKEVFHKDERLVIKPRIDKWDNLLPPYLPITILVRHPDGSLDVAGQRTTDERRIF